MGLLGKWAKKEASVMVHAGVMRQYPAEGWAGGASGSDWPSLNRWSESRYKLRRGKEDRKREVEKEAG